MPNSIEDIIIEIESDSTEAVSQLDILTERLQALKKATSGSASLANFSKNFENLNRTLSWMNTIDPAKVESIKNFAEGAASLKGITISKTIGEQLEKINNSVMNFSPEAISTISEIANSMFLLKEMQGFVYPSGLNKGLENTAKLAQQISGNDFTKLRELVDIIRDLGTISVEDSSAMRQLSTSIKGFTTATKAASTRGRTFNTVLANIRTRTLGMIMGLRWVSRIMTSSLSVYGNYVEALNLYKMAIGEAAGEEYEFAENAQKLLGIDLTQWMQAQGVFNALAKGFGVANDKATLMSRNLTQLAYDISSFYNISVEDAIQKVQSGFAGQIRPVRNLGYDLSQARLEAIALANGIDKEVKSMTQGEKSQLRYIALMTQLTEVQGDLARTLDSPTNQMRLLNAQLDQMQRSIGLLLLPLLNKMIPYLNAALRVIRMIAEEIAAMFGYTLPRLTGTDFSTNISMGADEIEESFEDATSAAEKLKNTLASFDQINLITSSSDSGGNGKNTSNMGSDLGLDLPSYDFLGDVTENQAQKIAEDMMKKLRPYIETLKDTIMWTYNHLDDIKAILLTIAGATVMGKLVTGVQDAWKWFKELSATAKAMGFITIGLSLSWFGGENIAKGDYLKGYIESAIGAVVTGLGFSFVAGPGGFVVGVGLSIAVSLFSFATESKRQFIEDLDDIFFAIDDGKRSCEEFAQEWDEFTKSLTNPAVENNQLKETKKQVDDIGTAINDLQGNYSAGVMSAGQYVHAMDELFSQMNEAVSGYLEEVGRNITLQLQGPWGLFLVTMGYTIEEVEGMWDKSASNIETKVGEVASAIHAAAEEYKITGDIEKYNKVYDEQIGILGGVLDMTLLSSEAVSDFNKETSGLNFSNIDEALDLLTQVNTSYDSALQKLDQEREDLIADLNVGLLGAETDAEREWWKGLIDDTEIYFDGQRQKLKEGFGATIGEIEGEITEGWARIYNEKGAGAAREYWEERISEIEEAIDNSYLGKEDLPRNQGWYAYLADIMKSNDMTIEGIKDVGLTSQDTFAYMMQTYKSTNEGLSKVFEKYKESTNGTSEQTGAIAKKLEESMPPAIKRMWEQANKKNEEGSEKSKYIASSSSKYFDSMLANLPISAETRMSMMNSVLQNKGFAMGQSTKSIADGMVKTFSQMAMPEEMQRVLARTQDMIKPAEFGLKGASVTKNFMDSFKKDFTPVQTVDDFKRKFGEMFQGDDANRWGVKLGESVKSGISTGLSGADNSIDYMLEGMAQSLNKFGDASFQYWTGMSSAIQAVWNAVKFDSTGKAYSTLMGAWAKASSWHIKGYASGGFPNTADFFYANENGVPELVGTMGGRTAVANNTEITKGVAEAVYKAIKETGIANDVRKIASKDGKIVFAPSEEAGRVVSQSVNMYNRTGGRY